MFDPLETATVVLAVATVLLAAFTGWLAIEARWARNQDKTEKLHVAFRAAVVEQLDNCRRWVSHSPDRGIQDLEHLQHHPVRLDAVEQLLGEVDLPSDLAAYVVWLLAEIRDLAEQFDAHMSTGLAEDLMYPDEYRSEWWVMTDRLQVLASLLAAEARKRGMKDVVQADNRWLRPFARHPQGRTMTEANDRAMRSAPAWPAGFDGCAPAKRDAEGAALAAQQQAQLSSSFQDVLRN